MQFLRTTPPNWVSDRFFSETKEQPAPVATEKSRVVLDYVINDLYAQAEKGKAHYGTMLTTHNGRDALKDAYQEALDLCMYLRQAILERDNQ